MQIREEDKGFFIDKVIEYAQRKQKRNKIMQIVSGAVATAGMACSGLAVKLGSPNAFVISAGVGVAGVVAYSNLGNKIKMTESAMERMQRDKLELQGEEAETVDLSMNK